MARRMPPDEEKEQEEDLKTSDGTSTRSAATTRTTMTTDSTTSDNSNEGGGSGGIASVSAVADGAPSSVDEGGRSCPRVDEAGATIIVNGRTQQQLQGDQPAAADVSRRRRDVESHGNSTASGVVDNHNAIDVSAQEEQLQPRPALPLQLRRQLSAVEVYEEALNFDRAAAAAAAAAAANAQYLSPTPDSAAAITDAASAGATKTTGEGNNEAVKAAAVTNACSAGASLYPSMDWVNSVDAEVSDSVADDLFEGAGGAGGAATVVRQHHGEPRQGEAVQEEEKCEIGDLGRDEQQAVTPFASAEATVLDEKGNGVAAATASAAATFVDETPAEFCADGTECEDHDLVAMKRMAYEGRTGGGTGSSSGPCCDLLNCNCPPSDIASALVTEADGSSDHQQATVVAIADDFYLHPSDPSQQQHSESNAVRAQFVGQADYASPAAVAAGTTATAAAASSQSEENHASAIEAVAQQGDDDDVEGTGAAEATVIDSAPVHCDDSSKYTEEAQVMLEEESSAPARSMSGFKPNSPNGSASDCPQRGVSMGSTTSVTAFADQEAEVVGIQEEAHPLEFAQDAEAELVGTDYSVTAGIAFPAAEGHAPPPHHAHTASSESVVVPPADVISAETCPPLTASQVTMVAESSLSQAVNEPVASAREVQDTTEVHATLVGRGYSEATSGSSNSTNYGPHRPSSAPYPPSSNPFEDDPGESPALSRDAIAQLDAQEGMGAYWMSAPTAVGTTEADEDSTSPPLPAVTLPTMSGPSPAAATAAAAGKTLGDDEGSSDNGNEDQFNDIPDWLRQANSPPQTGSAVAAPPPPPRPFGVSATQQDSLSSARAASSGGGTAASGERSLGSSIQSAISTNLVRGTSNVMEALFGDSKPPFMNRRAPVSDDLAASMVLSRNLLPWSVIYSPSTGMWVATLQTNQKALDNNDVHEASKSLRAFSLPTEKQAVCLARAWCPPRMLPFSKNERCHLCHDKFAVFRRACHCRNCGVCICSTSTCSTSWPAKMIPDTYNRKCEVNVHVCKTCDWLSNQFRLALLEGNFDKAVALHSTLNVNINSPFANVKGELFYPVHCAVLGGNLRLLKWLVDEHCCPIKSVRVSGNTKNPKYTAIVTSKGRSLLGIAMEHANTPIIRYLVVVKGISIAGEKDITPEMLVKNLETVLRLLPEPESDDHWIDLPEIRESARPSSSRFIDQASAPLEEELENVVTSTGGGRTLSEEAQAFGAKTINHSASKDEDSSEHEDLCILCYDNKIDCVSNPCGHQIMCIKCSQNISRCPVCASDCTFIRVYKP